MIDLDSLDRFQRLAFEAKFPVAILGNLSTADFELVQLGGTDVPVQLTETAAARGLEFLAVVGLVNGEPKSELAFALGANVIHALSASYCKLFEQSLRARLEIDSLGVLYDA